MKSWRERTIDAKERGFFNDEDWDMWRDVTTCPAAETVLGGYGMKMNGFCAPRGWGAVWRIGSDDFGAAMSARDFPAAHQALDLMADKALEIKRGLSNG